MMGFKKKGEQVPDPDPDASASGADEAEGEAGISELERLRRDNAELREALLRRQADFENARKRLRREADEAGNRALVRFIRPLLGELDNFQLAIEAANPEAFNDFAMGVSMIKSNIDNLLGGSGIEMVPAEGVFDPQWHEVIQEVEDPEPPKGTIVQVHRMGYKLGEQIIRAAQVVVTRPPAPPAEEPAEDQEPAEEEQQG